MLARPASGCWRPERTCSPDSSRSRAADGGAGIGRGSSAPTVPNTFSSVRACANPSRQEIRLKRTHPSFAVEKKSTKPKFQREFFVGPLFETSLSRQILILLILPEELVDQHSAE